MKSLALASTIAFSSCQMQPAFALDDIVLGQIHAEAVLFKAFYEKSTDSNRIKEGVKVLKNSLRDPYSAHTRNLYVKKFSDGMVVCGEVNAKNALGAYTGYTKFAAGATEAFFASNSSEVLLVCAK